MKRVARTLLAVVFVALCYMGTISTLSAQETKEELLSLFSDTYIGVHPVVDESGKNGIGEIAVSVTDTEVYIRRAMSAGIQEEKIKATDVELVWSYGEEVMLGTKFAETSNAFSFLFKKNSEKKFALQIRFEDGIRGLPAVLFNSEQVRRGIHRTFIKALKVDVGAKESFFIHLPPSE